MAQIKGPEAVAPAPSPNRNRNTLEIPSTPTDKPKQGHRRNGTHSYEEGGRYLYRYGANGVTVFDLEKWGRL